MERPVSFFSEGVKLAGDLFLPNDLRPGERRAGIVLCHGYTGVRNLYLPDIARILNGAGYVVLTFDYKGWGDSEGPPARLAPYSRVADVQAALSFLAAQDEADPERLGIYGTSYGGATVVFVAAIDPRVKCVVSVVGIGHGARWMRSVRHPDEYFDNGVLTDEPRVISGTPDPNLYALERYGHFTYSIPVDSRGRYTVVLHFAELYWVPDASGSVGVGTRLFRVYCNGSTLLDNFDIFKEAGSQHALTKTFYHLRPSAEGKLDLTFDPIVNYATISAIEVIDESE